MFPYVYTYNLSKCNCVDMPRDSTLFVWVQIYIKPCWKVLCLCCCQCICMSIQMYQLWICTYLTCCIYFIFLAHRWYSLFVCVKVQPFSSIFFLICISVVLLCMCFVLFWYRFDCMGERLLGTWQMVRAHAWQPCGYNTWCRSPRSTYWTQTPLQQPYQQ